MDIISQVTYYENGEYSKLFVSSDSLRYTEGFIEGFKASQQLNEKKFSDSDMYKCWVQATKKCLEPLTEDGFCLFIKSLSIPKTFYIEIEETPTTIKIIKKL